MPVFEVVTSVKFQNRYLIEAETSLEAREIVEQNCTATDPFDEVSQKFLGESIIDWEVVNPKKLEELFDRYEKNGELCSRWMGETMIVKKEPEDGVL